MSWLQERAGNLRHNIAVKAFKKILQEHPLTQEFQLNIIELFKEAYKYEELTQDGLIKIDPFEFFVDRDGNIYIKKGQLYETLEVIHKNTPDDEKLEESVWPNYIP